MSLSKLTILYLLDTLQMGGAEKSLLEITSRFHGFRPVFVTLFEGKHDLLAEYEKAGIKVIRLSLQVSNRFSYIAKLVDEIIINENAIIVHSTIFRSDMVARNLKSKVKIVNSLVNNSYRKRRYDGLKLKGKLALFGVQLLDRFTLSKVDLIIANSQVLVESHCKTIGLDTKKAIVIHRGRSVPSEIGHRKSDIFPNWGIEQKTWLCVGRLIERKGHKDLLMAFAQLLQSRPQDKLLIAGDGDYRPELEKLIQNMGIHDSVELLGTVKNVPKLLIEADFFVFPSYFEGLPGSLIEAMLAKIPIICSDIPENKECVDESMALFHKVGDCKDLLEQMEKGVAINDWDLRTQRAYEYALENFDIQKIAMQYEEVYKKLLEGTL